MNLRPARKDNVELNITPLIDVVFLLLIFFMVSTTFERESEINLTLPEASETAAEQKPVAINVAVDAEGQVFINGNPLVNSQLLTIREAIREAASGLEEPPIIISADESTDHQYVVRVMDAARQLNLVRIVFATRELDEER